STYKLNYRNSKCVFILLEDHIKVAGTGSTQCSGRVEIYHNNIWGTVCDDEWDLNDAAVVCRELNCGAALSAPTSALFGEGSDQIWLNKVACSGNERSLAECEHGGFAKHNCDHSVPIRLVGSTLLSGRVEIYYNNIWGTACDNGWDLNDASVVCRELGYGAALGAFSLASSGEDTGQIWLDDVDCSGNESSLTECQHNGFGKHNCRHSKDAGVVCSGEESVPIQLAGPTYCSGRVEVYNKTWGTVCGTSWDLNDASVVCRELGCGVAKKALQSFQFGNKPGQTWLYDVTCSGNESSLTQCQYSGFGNNNCSPAGMVEPVKSEDHSDVFGVFPGESTAFLSWFLIFIQMLSSYLSQWFGDVFGREFSAFFFTASIYRLLTKDDTGEPMSL
uniref:SRCR domain-containing protein n=1 Tax=Anabas testudineus TaxID=64144 RepID=A0A3Q1I898_ANATE